MGIDPLYGDTLTHVSGNIMKEALKEALGEYLEAGYIQPRVIRPMGEKVTAPTLNR